MVTDEAFRLSDALAPEVEKRPRVVRGSGANYPRCLASRSRFSRRKARLAVGFRALSGAKGRCLYYHYTVIGL